MKQSVKNAMCLHWAASYPSSLVKKKLSFLKSHVSKTTFEMIKSFAGLKGSLTKKQVEQLRNKA